MSWKEFEAGLIPERTETMSSLMDERIKNLTVEIEGMSSKMLTLQAENENLRKKKITKNGRKKNMKPKELILKISKKHACQLNGVRRFPVTFYKEEWKIIFGMREQIEKFLVEHDDELVNKGEYYDDGT